MTDAPKSSKHQIEKHIKLGLQYGMGADDLIAKLTDEAGITVESANQYLANFHKQHPEFKEAIENMKGLKLTGLGEGLKKALEDSLPNAMQGTWPLKPAQDMFDAGFDAGVSKKSMLKLMEKDGITADQATYLYDLWRAEVVEGLPEEDAKGLDLVAFYMKHNLSLDKKISKSKSLGLEFNLSPPTDKQKAEMAEEEAKDEKFDLGKFLPDTSMVETVKSNSSENVYALVGTKNGARVGISVTIAPVQFKKGEQPVLTLFCRTLELPEAEGYVSQFDEPGEARPYVYNGEPREVNMLTKFIWPLCGIQCSPWEVRSHLEAGVQDQIASFLWRLMEEAGCAINCNDPTALRDILFIRLDQLPDSPDLHWKTLDEKSPGKL